MTTEFLVRDARPNGDPASTVLHQRVGFEEVGRLRRVGFKHGRWIDTILMQRALDEAP